MDCNNNYISDNIIKENGNVGMFLDTDNSTIIGNFISDNPAGVILDSYNSTAFKNSISMSSIDGIYIFPSSNDNQLYHNNFIENTCNANDQGSNIWYYEGEGNYWDNWIGLKLKILRFPPYRISGTLFSNIDWYPAQELYKM